MMDFEEIKSLNILEPNTIGSDIEEQWYLTGLKHGVEVAEDHFEEQRKSLNTQDISDGYHTFKELYEYRLLYNACLFNEFAKQGLYDVHKSKRHSDGSIPFGDPNWFIVQVELPTGQISNHYEMKDWDLFKIPEKEKANTFNGHTSQDVLNSLRLFAKL